MCVLTVLLFLHTCKYKLCQAQKGSADCGIFALAFAYMLARGLHPSSYHFEQQRMHAHFHRCLVDGKCPHSPPEERAEKIKKSGEVVSTDQDILLLQDARKFW